MQSWWPDFAEFPKFCAFLHSQNLENSFSVMKKLMFTLAAVAVALTSAQAQKQMGDEHNIEVSFNPFSGSPIDASVIKYRKFLDDDAALRVSLGLNNTTNSYLVVPQNSIQGTNPETGQLADGTVTHPDLFLTNNSSSWSLSVGYEKHFRGTDNLSPYVALAVGYGSNTVDLTREHFSALNVEDASQEGSWDPEFDPANWGVWSYSNTITANQLNLDVLFGADYYFNDAIYVGFEAGLRFSNTSGITSKITTTDNNAFNMYFDADNNGGPDALVQNTLGGGSEGYQWSTATPVEYIINGEPWLPGNQAAYEAADELWYDWSSQESVGLDENGDTQAAFFNGSNFLGTYSTGMLRVGFLFN